MGNLFSTGIVCGEGTKLVNNECVADAPVICANDTRLVGNKCVAEDVLVCGQDTKLVNKECLPKYSMKYIKNFTGGALAAPGLLDRFGKDCLAIGGKPLPHFPKRYDVSCDVRHLGMFQPAGDPDVNADFCSIFKDLPPRVFKEACPDVGPK